MEYSWLRSTVSRTPVFGRRTNPVLRSTFSWRVTTMRVNRPLEIGDQPSRPTQPFILSGSSELQLDVCHLSQWRRHLVNAYGVNGRYGVLLQVKLCDPCLSALEWFVYHTRRYTSARIYLYLNTGWKVLIIYIESTNIQTWKCHWKLKKRTWNKEVFLYWNVRARTVGYIQMCQICQTDYQSK